jgi:cell division septal protein FtsQ
MTRKSSPRSRKKKRFNAASIPVLAPKTLKEGRRKQNSARKVKRQRQSTFFSKLRARSWGLSHYFAFLLLLGSIAALAFLFTDGRFTVSAVEITDPGYIDAGQIQRQADIAGANIFTIDPKHVTMRLATVMPQIKETHISLGLPNRATILVQERTPVLIYGHGSQTQWVDEEGRIFPATATVSDLPLLIDEDGSASVDGIHLNPAIWQAIQQITATIPGMNEFHYRDIYGLFFISPEGWRVYLGNGENMQNKLTMWQTLRQQILQENRAVKVIDLRYDRAYIQ